MATTPRLVIATIAATLGYLGLAVFGRGGAAFCSQPALIALAIATLVLSGAVLFSISREEPSQLRGVEQPLATVAEAIR